MDKENFKKKLGQNIARFREKSGYSQVELAQLIDREKQSINRLEKGGINPTVYELSKIAKILKVSLDDLVP